MAEPKCKYFGKCGGCSAQHVDYQLQLENKKKFLSKAIGFDDIEVHSGNEYNYRNRMDFIFNPRGLGMREKGKWYSTVDVNECVIADARINVLVKEIREFFNEIDAFNVKQHTGTFKFAVIRAPKNDSSISFTLNSDSSRLKDAVEKIKAFAKTTKANNVIVSYVPKNTDVSTSEDYFVVKGKDLLEEEYLGKSFCYSVQGFFQNNTEMAEKMHDYVHSLLEKYDTKNSRLLDLYGGVGTFGIINANLFNSVTIVEEFKGSIDAANKNIKKNSVENATAIALDAKQLKKIELPRPLFVITDPPRSGMHPKTIKHLNELEPEVIIYVSCNAKQLGKELKHFDNYKIKSAAIFDLFPHTPHFEAVIELAKQ